MVSVTFLLLISSIFPCPSANVFFQILVTDQSILFTDVSRGMLEEGDMTADSDRPISYLTTSSGGTSVKRSRTLPSGSKARRQENVSGGSNDSGLGGLGPASPSKEKENALVSFAEASSNAPSKGSAGAAKERRSVLVKKSRRASASVPNMSGGAERT